MASAKSVHSIAVPPGAAHRVDLRPTRAEVDLSAVKNNVVAVRNFVQTAVWGVVKADAYGHGAVAIAGAMVSAGVVGLCVALVEEGLELREAGISVPILVMSGAYRDGLSEALAARLIPVIYDRAQLDGLA